MKRLVHVAMLAVLALAPLAAQTPQGWKQRVDRSASATDPDAAGAIKFVTQGSGFPRHQSPSGGLLESGQYRVGYYTLKGTFTLMKPSGHTNYYGLVFGGSALEGADQAYLYFVVAQDGTWLLKSRAGAATPIVAPKTPNDAVKKPDASGQSVNALEVRVGADKVDFVVNGVVVHSEPKTGAMAKTDGIYGIRVNHLLEVQVDGFGVSK
jgi:hypothetical protein